MVFWMKSLRPNSPGPLIYFDFLWLDLWWPALHSLFFYAQLFRKGHRKGHTKAFFCAADPYRLYAIFSAHGLGWACSRSHHFFGLCDSLSGGPHQTLSVFPRRFRRFKQRANSRNLRAHVLVTFFVGSMDPLGALLIVAGLIVLVLTYTVRNGRPSPGLD